MRLDNQRGTAIVHLIIFVALWLLTTFLFFVFHSTQKIYEEQVANLEQQEKQLKKYHLEMESRLQHIESLTGFFQFPGEGTENRQDLKEAKVNVEKLIKNLNKINTKDNKEKKEPETGTRQYYGLTNLPSPDVEILEEKLTSVDYAINVENTIHAFVDRIYQLQNEENIIKDASERLKADKEIKNKEKTDVTQHLENILNSLEQQRKEMESKYQGQLDQIRDQKKQLEEHKADGEIKRKKLEKSIHTQQLEFENQISKKKSEIKKIQAAKYGRTTYSEITKQREFQASEEKEDGAVVFVDPRAHTVYINLGQSQRVIRGMKFDVFRRAEKGTRILRGRIEVQKVMDKVSMATIIEMHDQLDPIVTGDFIVNPVFEQEQPIYFAFAGKFKTVTNEQVKKLIESLGSKVEQEVTAKTNFVIVGQKGQDHPNYISAVTFGIPLMTEEVLLRYIGD